MPVLIGSESRALLVSLNYALKPRVFKTKQKQSWYLRYPLSYRDLEENFQERGFEVDRSTSTPVSLFNIHIQYNQGSGAETQIGIKRY